MKTKTILILLISMLSSCFMESYAQQSTKDMKILIAYYSLRNGNTRIVAEQIRKNVGGDIFRIETIDNYPAAYHDVTTQAKKELQSGYKPPLKAKVQNFEQYDIIYLGSPNWWNTVAPAVMTFLESYNFERKTIVPFITHEGSRMGSSVQDIQKLAPKATVIKGLPVRGSSVNNSEEDIQRWIKELKIKK